MVFNESLLFIHIPKTGGTSCTNYLCQHLAQPSFSSSLKSQTDEWHFNAKLLPGYSHETLSEAYSDYKNIYEQSGIDVRAIPALLAVIRDPVTLELSAYNFYRNGANNVLQATAFQVPEVKERIELAQGGLKHFIRHWGYFRDGFSGDGLRTEDYVTLDGELPENLTLLKVESLDQQFTALMRTFLGGQAHPFEAANVTKNPNKVTADDLDSETIECIYHKHRWLYDQGFYEVPQ
jgi:hypothetical protein